MISVMPSAASSLTRRPISSAEPVSVVWPMAFQLPAAHAAEPDDQGHHRRSAASRRGSAPAPEGSVIRATNSLTLAGYAAAKPPMASEHHLRIAV
jgi:hypothetical protein